MDLRELRMQMNSGQMYNDLDESLVAARARAVVWADARFALLRGAVRFDAPKADAARQSVAEARVRKTSSELVDAVRPIR